MYDTYPNEEGNDGISLLNGLKKEKSDFLKITKEIEDFSHIPKTSTGKVRKDVLLADAVSLVSRNRKQINGD